MIVLMVFSGLTLLELWLIGRAVGQVFGSGGGASVGANDAGGDVADETELAARSMAADLSMGDKEAVRLKEELQRKQITRVPTAMRRAGRRMMDRMGLSTRASMERRRREAMPRALELYQQRVAVSEKAFRSGVEDATLGPMIKSIDKGLASYADNMAQYEKEKRGGRLANEMRDIGNAAAYYKKERFRRERTQEILEKDLNQRLTKVADLERMVQSGTAGVTKTQLVYNSVAIPMYNMQGVPLKMLTTSISYKNTAAKALDGFAIGSMSMKALEVMPATWLDNEERMEQINSLSGASYAKRSNAISASYTDVSKNPEMRLGTSYDQRVSGAEEPYIVYGWDHIKPGSLYNAGITDLATPQLIPDGDTVISSGRTDMWDLLENTSGYGYNEVVLHRYDESGKAMQPDYLVIENGQISELIKYHAATFGVPIINVEREYYQ